VKGGVFTPLFFQQNRKQTVMKKYIYILFLIYPVTSHADWGDLLEIFSGDEQSLTGSVTELGDSEIAEGLKSALGNGVSSAIKNLGKTDGYYKNPRVKIPMPDSLQSVTKALRTIKQDKLADEFELTMNRAAEKAVPEAAEIFGSAIRDMSFTEAKEILQGPDNAATEYFRRTSGERIADKFLPVVADATEQVGVTSKFKSMMSELGPLARWIDTDAIDLDRYITDKAVDGLFLKIAEEEKLIRENPAARTNDILQRVFANQ